MDKIFFILYSVIITIIYVIALPFLFWFSKRRSKYKISIPARFFLKNNRPLKSDGIWFHSCSFGEARAIYSIVDKLPKELLRLTTTTQTGYEAISKKQSEQSRYMPFEPLLFFWLKPQKVLVVMEAEFWYLLFALAQKRGAKTLLINARMSDRSFHKYQRMSWFYKMIFAYIDEVYAQSEIDRERLELLGAKNVQVIGNVKLADISVVTKQLSKPKAMLVCAGSTHEGEEQLILEAFAKLKEEEKSAKLVVVPRHPERFEKVSLMVKNFAKEHHYSWHNYSDNEAFNSDIVVADILGELVNIYAISDIVILGGAFAKVGGHNAAEAAQFGCKIISGEHYFNQRDIFSMIEGIAIVTESNLARRLQQHGQLIPTKIIQRTDIEPILNSIKDVL
ncbi:3-deoxy-D-manno-octulosonic acid transferase [Sulfurovum sp. bin170]|uniref:lipid IV(A) 3-deoxy-D-manno-octulosonic acid transferase n=1 Tax=Sulfurovum sp. bin170 TaxID=2695268 RepID=UPI0013DF9ECB|nr:lipid IV(A) 3-deoxy-D-manno-octulosonic acid transferase [Sulfurovum sp. bin170]NEW61014.1 3-deoxy-D-manno-octulosonic acid transferase [Sulfurovum sp. bin170]